MALENIVEELTREIQELREELSSTKDELSSMKDSGRDQVEAIETLTSSFESFAEYLKGWRPWENVNR